MAAALATETAAEVCPPRVKERDGVCGAPGLEANEQYDKRGRDQRRC
jgi:hypothetical protein